MIHNQEILDFLHRVWENDPKSAFGFGMTSNSTCPRLPAAVKVQYTRIVRALASFTMTEQPLFGPAIMKKISPRYASYSENNNILLRREENLTFNSSSQDHQLLKLRYMHRYDDHGVPAYFFKALMDVGASDNVDLLFWQDGEPDISKDITSTKVTLFYLNHSDLSENGVKSWRSVTKLVNNIKSMISTKNANATTTFEGGMFEVLTGSAPHAISILPCGDNYIVCNTWGNECTRANNQNSNNSQQISDDFKWSQLIGVSLIFIVHPGRITKRRYKARRARPRPYP